MESSANINPNDQHLQLGLDDEDPDIFVGGNDDNASTRTSSDNECGGDDNG